MRPLAAVVLVAALAGCQSAATVDESQLFEGSIASVRNSNLAALVRALGARSPDASAHRILSDLLQGRKVEPPIEGEGGSPVCEATVVRSKGETFVMVGLAPWGTPASGGAWIHLFLFDAAAQLLDHAYGEVPSGRLDLEFTGSSGGRLACKIAAPSNTKAQLQHGSKRFTLTARKDPDKPVPSSSGVVCQVTIRSRKLNLLHPDLTE